MSKKKTPAIRFKEFTDDWEQYKLEDCIEELKSGLSRMLSETDIGLPTVRANNIENGKLDLKNSIKYWFEIDPQGADTNNYLIHKGDILINFINSDAKMGTAAIVDKEPSRKTIYTTNILKLKTNKLLNSRFFLAHSMNKVYKDYIKSISKIAVNQASFTTVDFKKYNLYLPIYPEQEKIGQYFKALDNLITLHQRKCEKLKIFKKAMLEKMFPKNNEKIPEVRFKGFTDAWEQCTLENFGKATSGTSLESEFKINNGTHKVISIGSYSEQNKYIDQNIRVNITPNTKNCILNKNNLTMLLNDKTSSGNILGRVLLIDADDTYVYNQRTQRIELNESKFNPTFCYHFFNANSNRKRIISASQGNTQIYVNWSVIKKLNYFLPFNIKEQIKIGKLYNKIDNLITLHQRKVEKLQIIKKSMQEKMFV